MMFRCCSIPFWFLAATPGCCKAPIGPESYLPAQNGYSVYPSVSYGSRHLCLGNCWLVSWAAVWAPLTVMTCCPWLQWERGPLVHLHILPCGYLVPNPEIFCGSVKTIRIFVQLQMYQNFQWTNMDIHVSSVLSSLTLKTPTTLQSKRTKSPGGHKVHQTPLVNDGKMASNIGSLAAVKKRNLFFGVFRSSTSVVNEGQRERAGWEEKELFLSHTVPQTQETKLFAVGLRKL